MSGNFSHQIRHDLTEQPASRNWGKTPGILSVTAGSAIVRMKTCADAHVKMLPRISVSGFKVGDETSFDFLPVGGRLLEQGMV